MKSTRETRFTQITLSPQEILERGRQLAQAHAEQDELNSREQKFKASLKVDRTELEKRIQDLALAVRTGSESREVTVITELDHRNGIATERLEGTGEIVAKRALTSDERQLSLLDD
jgi:hypothetical protein